MNNSLACLNDIDKEFLLRAINIAQDSVNHKNHPFGALLVIDGKVILTAENTQLTDKDITGHAELNLVRQASKLDGNDLSRAVFYTSTEPCVMCSAAIVKLKINKLVYGCSTERMSENAGGGSFSVPCRTIFNYYKGKIPKIIGPELTKESEEIHSNYWNK